MRSLRVWFAAIALGAAMMVLAPSAKAQVPKAFSYQGFLEENGVPLTGNISLTITLAPQNGSVLWSETLPNVDVSAGIFNLVIGNGGVNPAPFPVSMDFNEQYFLTMTVTSSAGTTTLPPTPLLSAPYAINSGTVNGISASQVPVANELFPVPIGTGYTGSAKMDPAFLPNSIPNSLLGTPDITQINNTGPNSTGNFQITAGNGITVTSSTNGLTISAPSVIGNTSLTTTTLTVQNGEANGNEALLVRGGIGANNPTGTSDGDGINTPQTYWADQVAVPSSTGTTLVVLNTLVSASSTIVVTPLGTIPTQGAVMITSQGAGTFTVSSKNVMGTTGGGATTAINYMVVNH